MRCAALLALFVTLFPVTSAMNSHGRVPVLLELFTSESCSSCPPADRLLEELSRAQPFPEVELIVLSEHVDYFNDLGWADPFSSRANTSRQERYAEQMKSAAVYTPQLVIDGTYEVIGSDRRAAEAAIRKAGAREKLPLHIAKISRSGREVRIRISLPADGKAGKHRLLVALAQAEAVTRVPSGENAGRTLRHTSVSRQLVDAGTLGLADEWTKEVKLTLPRGASGAFQVVAFVADAASGRVEGVTSGSLPH